ncbi:MAG: site-specific integrase [Ruthenibacterium sp.]
MSKRNAQGNGTIRQRSNGRWEARYTTGKDAGTGKQVQRSVYGATQAEVRKKLTALLKDIDGGVYQEPSRLTLAQWLDIWLAEYVKPVAKHNTYASYELMCRVHIKPNMGASKLQAVTAYMLQRFFNSLQSGDNGAKPLSPKSIKNCHGVLHRALATAAELHYIPFNPADNVKLPRVVRKEIKPLNETQIGAFLKLLEQEPYKNLYIIALFTGMREGEILGLSWDCIDFTAGTITVKRQLQREKTKGGQYYFSTPKSGKPRVLIAANFVMTLLKEEKRTQTENKLRAGTAWCNPDNLIFTSATGQHLAIQTVYLRYKRIAEQLGIPTSRFHDLRHTYAVTAIQEGDDIKTVQENLGHATASFTLDVYAHCSDKMKLESKKHMDEYIEAVKRA